MFLLKGTISSNKRFLPTRNTTTTTISSFINKTNNNNNVLNIDQQQRWLTNNSIIIQHGGLLNSASSTNLAFTNSNNNNNRINSSLLHRTFSSSSSASNPSPQPPIITKRPSPEELKSMNELVWPMLQGEKGGNPLKVIEWARDQYDGRVAMSTSMGIQAAVLLHMATRVMPNIPVVWVDTGYLPKETYLYGEELRQTLGLNLIVVNNSQWSAARLEAIHGKLWEKDDADSHTLYGKLTKVEPLASGLHSINPSPLALLSGLRSGQTKARADMEPVGFSQGRFKILPMLKMSDADVVEYMDKYDLPKHPLQAKGYVTVGDWHSSRPVQPGEDGRATRFGGKFEECGLHVDTHEPVKKSSTSSNSTTTTTTTNSSSPTSTTPSTTNNNDEPTPLLPPGLESLGFARHHPSTDLAIIMVKKKQEDGTWCRKCNDVAEKMKIDDVEKYVSHIAVADVLKADSEGVLLAQRFQVATAPFFLVRTKEEEQQNGQWKPIRAYLQLRKLIEDAKEKKSKEGSGEEIKESEEVITQRLQVEELKAQISLLNERLKASEKTLVEMMTK
jgi:phosphoadenosine phosphosulfate reductase